MSKYSRSGKPSSRSTNAKRGKRHPLFGALKGVASLPPEVDLTEPADPDWGKVYEEDAVVPAKRSARRDP